MHETSLLWVQGISSFSFMTNQEFPCDRIQGKISHKLQVLLPAKVSIFTQVMLFDLLSQDVGDDLSGLKWKET